MSDSPASVLELRVEQTLEFLGNPILDFPGAPYYCGKGEDLPERITAWNTNLTNARLVAEYWARKAEPESRLTGLVLEIGNAYWVRSASDSRSIIAKALLAGFQLCRESRITQVGKQYFIQPNVAVKLVVVDGDCKSAVEIRQLENIQSRDRLKTAEQVCGERNYALRCEAKNSVNLWQVLRLMYSVDRRLSIGYPSDLAFREGQHRSKLREMIERDANKTIDDIPLCFVLHPRTAQRFYNYRSWCHRHDARWL